MSMDDKVGNKKKREGCNRPFSLLETMNDKVDLLNDYY